MAERQMGVTRACGLVGVDHREDPITEAAAIEIPPS
jgi:hypothetical protein